MPKQYEAIRDSLVKKGLSLKKAKTQAAKIYNSKHKKSPVGRYSDTASKRKQQKKTKRKK